MPASCQVSVEKAELPRVGARGRELSRFGGGGESALKLNIRIRHQAADETAGGRKKREEGGSQDVTDGQESDGVQA